MDKRTCYAKGFLSVSASNCERDDILSDARVSAFGKAVFGTGQNDCSYKASYEAEAGKVPGGFYWGGPVPGRSVITMWLMTFLLPA
jgi:hypothetical protein